MTVSLNAAATIEDTLASVRLQQSDFGIEHICVDGGSTDSTREIIDRWCYQSNTTRKIFEPDSGIFDAMNKGLFMATGEYILFLNADDFLVEKNVLMMALSGITLGNSRNPDLIAGDVAMGNLGHRGLWRHRKVPRLLGRVRSSGLFPVHQGLLVKRQLICDLGGFDPHLKLASDVICFYELEAAFEPSIRFINCDIAFMRDGGASNVGVGAIISGTMEIYHHLRRKLGVAHALRMVLVKSLQSALEMRFGKCPHVRWFATPSKVACRAS